MLAGAVAVMNLTEPGTDAGPAVSDMVFAVAGEYRPARPAARRPGYEDPFGEIFCGLCHQVERTVVQYGQGDPEGGEPDGSSPSDVTG